MKVNYINENGNVAVFDSGENLRRTESDWECIYHTLVKRYYSENIYKLAKDNEELLHILANKIIIEMRYKEVMERLDTGLSKPGTYPDWVVERVERHQEEMIQEMLSDAFDHLKNSVKEEELTLELVAVCFGIKEDYENERD